MEKRIVAVPVADMRVEPKHRSERASQALYGHWIEVVEARAEFVLAQSDDGYNGWILGAYLHSPASNISSESIVTSQIAVFSGSGGRRLSLPYGARLRSLGGERFAGVLGDSLDLIFGRVSLAESVPLADALKEAFSLVSVPYLWGGASSYGYDCSGFVQAIFRRLGQTLPRDSKDQANVGTAVKAEDVAGGDLVCFPGHIALALGDGLILHSSRLRGGVQVESLVPRKPDFREDLAGSITTIRRVLQ